MSAPKISVIIPAYNAAPYLARTLELVFRQQTPAHEIIVVNDGSTDNTQQIIDRYRGKIVTKTIKNSGCSAGRNEGVRLSTGDVLAFLDADDLWFRKKLKVISEYLLKYPDSNFFCSNYLVHSSLHRRLVRHYDHLPNRGRLHFNEPLLHPFTLMLTDNFVGTPSAVVVRKKFFESMGGFDANCRLAEDLDFFLRAASKTNFVLSQF